MIWLHLALSSTVQCSVQGSAHYNNQAMALGELLPYIHQQMDNCISGYTLCTNAASIAIKIGTNIKSSMLYQKDICFDQGLAPLCELTINFISIYFVFFPPTFAYKV